MLRTDVEVGYEEGWDGWIHNWGWGQAAATRITFFWLLAFGVVEVGWLKDLGSDQYPMKKKTHYPAHWFAHCFKLPEFRHTTKLFFFFFLLFCYTHIFTPLEYFLGELFKAHRRSLKLLLYSSQKPFPPFQTHHWEHKSLETETMIPCLLHKFPNSSFRSLSASEEKGSCGPLVLRSPLAFWKMFLSLLLHVPTVSPSLMETFFETMDKGRVYFCSDLMTSEPSSEQGFIQCLKNPHWLQAFLIPLQKDLVAFTPPQGPFS